MFTQPSRRQEFWQIFIELPGEIQGTIPAPSRYQVFGWQSFKKKTKNVKCFSNFYSNEHYLSDRDKIHMLEVYHRSQNREDDLAIQWTVDRVMVLNQG